MKFGYFDDANKEYVINSPKTPYPWINYLGNQGSFLILPAATASIRTPVSAASPAIATTMSR